MDTPTYKNANCLVTGGLGFIGSNLALRLATGGARVTVIDASTPQCGANPFNLETAPGRIRILQRDIGDTDGLRDEIDPPDVIFNLAGEISHTLSMSDPERDLELNARSQLRFLMFCRDFCPNVRIVHASTRQVYGRCEYLPVNEEHPIQPIDFNGIHKHAAEQYHLFLSRRGELDCVVLRLSNVYGSRMALHLAHQGVLSVFFRQALLGRPLVVYDGGQVRDPIYVDDAVDAFLRAGCRRIKAERLYNIGGAEKLSLRQIADTVSRVAGLLDPVVQSFPSELESIHIGDYATDGRKAAQHLHWKPKVCFADGVRHTLEYYQRCGFDYVNFAPGRESLEASL